MSAAKITEKNGGTRLQCAIIAENFMRKITQRINNHK